MFLECFFENYSERVFYYNTQPQKAKTQSPYFGTEVGIGWRVAEACIIPEINRSKENVKMKKNVAVLSILVFLSGLTVFLQGINILPGSYMTGDPKWAIIGGFAMVISAGWFWFANRKR
jgi:hypothetical protein